MILIEKIILDYLMQYLRINNVYLEVPLNPPNQFIVIEKLGSSKANHLKESTIAIQSYDSSLFKTAELNERVKEAMEEIITLDIISKCKLNSDYNFTDTTTKKYRYQAIFDLVHY